MYMWRENLCKTKMGMVANGELIYFFKYTTAIEGIFSPTGTLKRIVQTLSTFAYPANLPSWHPRHQCVIGNIMRDDGSRSNEGRTAYRMATHNRGIGAQRSAFTNQGSGINTMRGEMCPRRVHIGKDTARTAEYIILNFNTFVNGYIVLHSNSAPNSDIVSDVHILAERAVLTNTGASLNVTKMPYLGAFAYDYIIINITAFVNKWSIHVLI